MSYPLINGAVINGSTDPDAPAAESAFASGTPAWWVGAPNLLPEFILDAPSGTLVVQIGSLRALVGQPPADVMRPAAGLRAVSIGPQRTALAQPAAASTGLSSGRVGFPSTVFLCPAQEGVFAAHVGAPLARLVLRASGPASVAFGTPATTQLSAADGSTAARIGMPTASVGGLRATHSGWLAAHIGAVGAVGSTRRARGMLAARIGAQRIDRGAAC